MLMLKPFQSPPASPGRSMSPVASTPLRVLVYSDDKTVRESVRLLLGPRPAPELPAIEYVECATEPVVISAMDAGRVDLAILDGEATPAGGMGIARQLKSEIYRCPPILVLIARPQDAWLAKWSLADEAVLMPPDPLEFPETVAALLRGRLAPVPQSATAG
jgi:DNA-binding response OmpR family regulator